MHEVLVNLLIFNLKSMRISVRSFFVGIELLFFRWRVYLLLLVHIYLLKEVYWSFLKIGCWCYLIWKEFLFDFGQGEKCHHVVTFYFSLNLLKYLTFVAFLWLLWNIKVSMFSYFLFKPGNEVIVMVIKFSVLQHRFCIGNYRFELLLVRRVIFYQWLVFWIVYLQLDLAVW